jgi:hypothetical protein
MPQAPNLPLQEGRELALQRSDSTASALRVTVKPRYRDWSSWTVVQVSDADGIDVHREYAESQAVRE